MKKMLFLLLCSCSFIYSENMIFGPGVGPINWSSEVPGGPETYCERRKWRRACKKEKEQQAVAQQSAQNILQRPQRSVQSPESMHIKKAKELERQD